MKLFGRKKSTALVVCEEVKQPEVKKEWNPVRDNKEFIHEHWDLYPDPIKEHIKNYDLIDITGKELDKLSYSLEYSVRKIEEYTEIARDASSLNVDITGLLTLISNHDKRIQTINERIKQLPETGILKLKNRDIEKQMEPLGWYCSYGTGGLHWNKSGVVQDGFGKYGCIDLEKSIGGCK